MPHYNVCIVGGGPVGLFTAIELALTGLSVIIYDKRTYRSPHSRGLAVHGRTLGVMSSRGLLQPFLDVGTKVPVSHYGALGALVHLGKLDVDFPFVLHIPQAKTEEILEKKALALGITFLRGHVVQQVEQDVNGVSIYGATLDGIAFSATADYVVGADGARSTIRKAIGVSFDGYNSVHKFILADIQFMPGLDLSLKFRMNPDNSGNSLIIPYGDGVHHRVCLIDPEHMYDDPSTRTSETQLLEIMNRLRPELPILSVPWISSFTDETKIASKYVVGRIVLAGDAAHIHMPAGGLGMNIGLQDAFNLGWKLAAVLHGKASPNLLQTYEIERRPIAIETNRRTLAQGPLLLSFDQQTASLRQILQDWLNNPDVNRTVALSMSGFATTYHPVPEVEDGLRLIGNWKKVKESTILREMKLHQVNENGQQSAVFLSELLQNGDWVEIWRADKFDLASDLGFPGWTRRAVCHDLIEELGNCKALLVRPDGHLGYVQ